MKKIILSAFFLIGLVFSSKAQDISKSALGLRLGSNDGFGGEISYQHGLSKNNRLEIDLGWRNSNDVDAIKVTGLYQWVWNIDGGFNWYAGVGGGIGSWSVNDEEEDNSGIILFAAGDIGIEYTFKEVPIQLSLDIRPELYFNSDDYREKNFAPDLAFGIRYRW